jgi:hypothetical protein
LRSLTVDAQGKRVNRTLSDSARCDVVITAAVVAYLGQFPILRALPRFGMCTGFDLQWVSEITIEIVNEELRNCFAQSDDVIRLEWDGFRLEFNSFMKVEIRMTDESTLVRDVRNLQKQMTDGSSIAAFRIFGRNDAWLMSEVTSQRNFQGS